MTDAASAGARNYKHRPSKLCPDYVESTGTDQRNKLATARQKLIEGNPEAK